MTRLSLRLSAEASREIIEAVEWWQANRPAAPSFLKEELRRSFELLRTRPGAGMLDDRVHRSGVRRLHLTSVRYALYYSVSPDDSTIEILSLWHSSRGVGPEL